MAASMLSVVIIIYVLLLEKYVTAEQTLSKFTFYHRTSSVFFLQTVACVQHCSTN